MLTSDSLLKEKTINFWSYLYFWVKQLITDIKILESVVVPVNFFPLKSAKKVEKSRSASKRISFTTFRYTLPPIALVV